MDARSLVKPTESILNSCYEISEQIVSVNGALWLVKSGSRTAPRAEIAELLPGFRPQSYIQSPCPVQFDIEIFLLFSRQLTRSPIPLSPNRDLHRERPIRRQETESPFRKTCAFTPASFRIVRPTEYNQRAFDWFSGLFFCESANNSSGFFPGFDDHTMDLARLGDVYRRQFTKRIAVKCVCRVRISFGLFFKPHGVAPLSPDMQLKAPTLIRHATRLLSLPAKVKRASTYLGFRNRPTSLINDLADNNARKSIFVRLLT